MKNYQLPRHVILQIMEKKQKQNKTVSHRPKLCAIETSRDVGIGAQGGVSVSSQTMKRYWFLHRKMVTLG